MLKTKKPLLRSDLEIYFIRYGKLFGLFLLFFCIGFAVGYGSGVNYTARIGIQVAEKVLDIKINPVYLGYVMSRFPEMLTLNAPDGEELENFTAMKEAIICKMLLKTNPIFNGTYPQEQNVSSVSFYRLPLNMRNVTPADVEAAKCPGLS